MSAADDEEETQQPEPEEKQPIPVIFHQTSKGNEPVRKWLKELPDEVRRAVGGDIWLLQREWPVGKPLVDGFGDGLYEVRTEIDKNIYRVLFCFSEETIVVLHSFQKKTMKTPKQDVELARKRQKEHK